MKNKASVVMHRGRFGSLSAETYMLLRVANCFGK